MIWSLAGCAFALAVAAAAWRRSRGAAGFYDGDTYGMDRRAHVRYAAISLAFVSYFAFTSATHNVAAGIAGLALYALVAIFYATSFLRGSSDE